MRQLILLACCLSSIIVYSQNTQTGGFKRLDPAVAKEMIDNYDGLLRNHKKTDGLSIKADEFVSLMNKFGGREISIVYGRVLKNALNNKKRVTLILVVKKDISKQFLQNEYYDLGLSESGESRLCPPPSLCGLDE